MKVKEKMVRNARILRGISQDNIAHHLNISQSKYSKLENGEIPFDIKELSLLIDLLELNPLEVIDFTDKQQVFINSSYSGNTNTTIKGTDIETIRAIIKEELKNK